jgi:hypothetical protein
MLGVLGRHGGSRVQRRQAESRVAGLTISHVGYTLDLSLNSPAAACIPIDNRAHSPQCHSTIIEVMTQRRLDRLPCCAGKQKAFLMTER